MPISNVVVDEDMKLNANRIKAIAQDSPTAQMLFQALAARERDNTITDIKRMRLNLTTQGRKITPTQIRDFFRALQSAGVGKVTETAAGYPDKFEWFTSLKLVGEIGAGKQAAREDALDITGRMLPGAAVSERSDPERGRAPEVAALILNNASLPDSDKVKMLKVYFGL